MKAVVVDRLKKFFGHFAALNGITFSAARGEILGLLGPNGAGKTTTMRILTTFLPPSGGQAQVAGFDVVKQSMEVRKRIGYMQENPTLYEDMRVGKFLRFMGELKRISSKKLSKRLEFVRDAAKIEDVWEKYITQLSKGYRQRVSLALAILADPPVLILDEPTIGLDPKQIRYIRELIKSMGGNHTVIVSTHILPEAEMLCDRLAIINKGKIIALGTAKELSSKIRKVNAVRVELSGQPDEVEKELLQLDGVIGVIQQERNEVFLIEFETKFNTLEQISKIAAKRNWVILELSPIEASLEEVFLELVADETTKSLADTETIEE